MRIAFITVENILGEANAGGVVCAQENLKALKKIAGEQNVFSVVLTKDLLTNEQQGCLPLNTKYYYVPRNSSKVIRNAFQGRMHYDKRVEKEVYDYILDLKPHVIFFDGSRMGHLLADLGNEFRKIVFYQNIERYYILNRAKRSPIYYLLYPAYCENEKLATKFATQTICLNLRDAGLLKGTYNREADLILPAAVKDSFPMERIDDAAMRKRALKNILFVGSLFPPNWDGIRWFVEKVMPYVRCKLTLVGRGFETKKDMLSRDNVTVVGTVSDLSPYYLQADAMVMPIRFGDGMKFKTAEALMYGKHIFATDEALEGYDVDEISEIVRCNCAEEFIGSLNACAKTETVAQYNEPVRSVFLDKYEEGGKIEKLKNFLLSGRR